jgi:GT2 family glycosyltransferase
VATINDDAAASPEWLEALVGAIDSNETVGMCASCVLLSGAGRLDSAGLLLCGDGSSKQRGHGEPAERWPVAEEALMPSGSAALYRRSMLDQTGWFDEDFFLYCEDTDLGLRARWAGWTCLYVPGAKVSHRYSHSAGRASPLKAYYVERNRLFVAVKNFPAGMLASAGLYTAARYFWHAAALMSGRGAAGGFRAGGGHPLLLAWLVIRSHLAALAALPRLLRQRRQIRRTARIGVRQFRELARRYAIGPREVAMQ